MTRTSCALIGAIMLLNTTAQTELTVKLHRHEAGVDVTAFLRQFLNWGGGSDPYAGYTLPSYMAAYRYHIGRSDIRFGIGWYGFDEELPAYWYNSPQDTYRNKHSELTIRIGFEWHQELNKRWQVFYGLDFRPSWISTSTQWTYSNAGYRHGAESTDQLLAITPLLGVRYRITPRFSLLTESSFSFIRHDGWSRQFSEPMTVDYPPIPDETLRRTSFRTSYQVPLSVIAAFDL